MSAVPQGSCATSVANAFGVNTGAQSVGGAFAFFGLLLLFPGVNILLITSVLRGYTIVSVISLPVMLLSGPVLYVASCYVRARQGIDVTLAMRELPPE